MMKGGYMPEHEVWGYDAAITSSTAWKTWNELVSVFGPQLGTRQDLATAQAMQEAADTEAQATKEAEHTEAEAAAADGEEKADEAEGSHPHDEAGEREEKTKMRKERRDKREAI